MFRDLLARTVSSSLLGVDIVVAGTPARGTFLETEKDADFIAGEGISGQTIIRTPVAGLPAEPAKNDIVEVGGETYRIDNCWKRGGNFLIELKRVAVR